MFQILRYKWFKDNKYGLLWVYLVYRNTKGKSQSRTFAKFWYKFSHRFKRVESFVIEKSCER